MDNEENVKDEPAALGEVPEVESVADIIEPRAKSPWKAFVLTGFLAGLIGAIGGGAGLYAGLKRTMPKPITPIVTDLQPLETKINQLATRLKAAEAELQKAASRPVAEVEPVDISGLETRLQVLETAPRPEIDPAALSALQAAQNDGFEWPDVSKLEDRLSGVESKINTPVDDTASTELLNRLTDLEENIEALPNVDSAATLSSDFISGLETRLEALETRPAASPVVKRVSILSFPKDSLIDTLEANKEGGLFEKTLSRHIRVKDDNNPLTLIEGIEIDLSEGRLAPALEKFERLPEPVRSAGQAWYESVKASL